MEHIEKAGPGIELRVLAAERRRQIETDLEAIRGIATIRHWPLDIRQEIPR